MGLCLEAGGMACHAPGLDRITPLSAVQCGGKFGRKRRCTTPCPPFYQSGRGLPPPLCCLANKSQARLCSERLQSALEQNLNGPGSTIYQTVWKPHVTPLGRQIYRLRASARRTSDSEPSLVRSGWGTPRTFVVGNEPKMADWEARNQRSIAKHGKGMGKPLELQAALSGWPSPTVGNATGSQMAKGASTTGRRPDGSKATVSLNAVAQASGWPTPTTRDHKDGKECPNVPLNALLGRVAWLSDNPQAARITADGMMLTGCSAGMESGGQLNPAFSAWLMGFPEAWYHAAISCQLPPRLHKAPKRPVA